MSFFYRKSQLTVVLTSIFLSDFALAGNTTDPLPLGTPSAGSILRQIEQLQPQQVLPTTPEVKPAPKEIQKSTAKVMVKGFRFKGNHLFTQDELAGIVKQYIGKELTIEDLQNVAAEVSTFYRNKGYLAVARLPKQDVTDGVITIEVDEAKYGGILLPERIENNLHRVNPDVLESFMGNGQQVTQPLSLQKLDRAILITNDLPGVEAQGNLVPGDVEGETKVAVDARDKPLLSGDVTIDNWGSRATGQNRALADLLIASPTGIGDLVSLSGLYTDGSQYGRLEYALPLGYDGWRLGVNTSHLNYHLITSDFVATQPKGLSSTYGLDTQYPLVRTQSYNLTLTSTFDYKYFNNQYLSSTGGFVPSSDYTIQVYTIGLTEVKTDDWLGGGTTVTSLNYGIGSVDLANSPNFVSDSLNAQTNGGYQRLRLALNRTQTLTQDYSMYFSFQGQFANKNLDPSEKLYLGGPTGVRAYPLSEGGGDVGYIENLELRKQVNNRLQFAGFLDNGMVSQNKNNYSASGQALNLVNAYHLSGYGLMATYIGPYKSLLKLIWSHRIGGNPNPTTTGLDQAGSLIYNQFWMSAMLPF
ncbi:ShlB/FhaC/HecB family hemolysin secretion/activation protein [Ferrovum sp. PN-J185]|uniref:ShlB/FhaC/HecB family hemolysin secretion/activation protein n=1 Tax=Ferrovum sp. PN-J185 TaxID=1356306 RepID=UPI000796DC79|nr:ShlB/FhaC/HecB family hemolysin secretion/activation protein [Ferrovum sp. PN-J185]KXW55252.1 heme/hemopexin transporter protein HuxB precursor [Ferrovum sp. PN-J185]MCC6068067.1 ShlB/FhaC/HecB family hemolysin secretion/activation protein [Ferrovum sp. PN-J185]